MDAKIICLGVLMMKDATGYEINKSCTEGAFSHVQRIGYGSIYPTLEKLLEEKMISLSGDDNDDNTHSKKIYSITDKGKEYLMRKLQKNPAASKYKSEILFSLCFSDYLSEAHAEFLLELYLKEVKNRISFLEVEPGGTPMTAGRNFVRGLGIKMYSSAVEYILENKKQLIEEIKENNRKG